MSMRTDMLLTCPWCKTPNFSDRGLRAHRCRARGRRPLSAPALHMARKAAAAVRIKAALVPPTTLILDPSSLPASEPMPKGKSNALTLVSHPEFAVAKPGLARLKEVAVAQVAAIGELESKAALGALVAGLTLHRVKASLPHGQFVKWLESAQKCTTGALFKRRQAAYYMALALVFLDKARVEKPDILALPGDQLSLDVGDGHAARQFFAKAQKFVGDLSLNELLIKHGLKGVCLQKELAKANEKPVLTAEQLYQQSRDEIGQILMRSEEIFLKENRLQHLAGHPEEITGVVASLRRLADKVEAAAKPLTKG